MAAQTKAKSKQVTEYQSFRISGPDKAKIRRAHKAIQRSQTDYISVGEIIRDALMPAIEAILKDPPKALTAEERKAAKPAKAKPKAAAKKSTAKAKTPAKRTAAKATGAKAKGKTTTAKKKNRFAKK